MDSKEERQHKLQLATGLARRHNPLTSRLIRETAEWMATEVKRCGRLDHHQAANAIRQRSPYHELFGGRALTYVTQERDDRDGSIREVYRFGPAVLEAFKELTGKTVKWGKQNRYWIAVKPKHAQTP
jgi:hypothetical protein